MLRGDVAQREDDLAVAGEAPGRRSLSRRRSRRARTPASSAAATGRDVAARALTDRQGARAGECERARSAMTSTDVPPAWRTLLENDPGERTPARAGQPCTPRSAGHQRPGGASSARASWSRARRSAKLDSPTSMTLPAPWRTAATPSEAGLAPALDSSWSARRHAGDRLIGAEAGKAARGVAREQSERVGEHRHGPGRASCRGARRRHPSAVSEPACSQRDPRPPAPRRAASRDRATSTVAPRATDAAQGLGQRRA